MIVSLYEDKVELDLLAGRLSCACAGRLAPWGHARPRVVRHQDGHHVSSRPRRVICTSCRRTHVLVALAALPRRRDAVETVGAALLKAAGGHGHRVIADQLGLPPSTVRNWLRRAAVELSISAARPCERSSRWAARSATSSRGPHHWPMRSKPSGLPRRRRCAGSGGPVPRRGASSRRSAVACSWRRCPAVDRTRWTSDRARPDRDRRHRHDHPTPPIMDTKPQVRAHRTCRLRAHLSRRATVVGLVRKHIANSTTSAREALTGGPDATGTSAAAVGYHLPFTGPGIRLAGSKTSL